jgi:hypothetical protein
MLTATGCRQPIRRLHSTHGPTQAFSKKSIELVFNQGEYVVQQLTCESAHPKVQQGGASLPRFHGSLLLTESAAPSTTPNSSPAPSPLTLLPRRSSVVARLVTVRRGGLRTAPKMPNHDLLGVGTGAGEGMAPWGVVVRLNTLAAGGGVLLLSP